MSRRGRRVLLWTGTFMPSVGGVEVLAERLALALRERGFRLLVLTPEVRGAPSRESWGEGVAIERLPFVRVLARRDAVGFLDLKRRVARLKHAFDPGLVHVNALHPGICFHLETHALCPRPQLVTLHAWRELRSGPDTVFGRLLRGADWVVSCSRSALEKARQAVPRIEAVSSVIPNGVSAAPGAVVSSPSFDPPRVLCLGRLEEEKGFDLALDAFSRVKTRWPDARLTVAGEGPARRALEQRAREPDLDGSVDFRGLVRPRDVPALLGAATLMVVPSRFEEGSSLVVLEAALQARPVVAARIGALPEVVVHDRTGLLVPTGDVSAMAVAIARLLEDRDLAAAMGRRARQRALDEFSWEAHLQAYLTLYDRLLESHAA